MIKRNCFDRNKKITFKESTKQKVKNNSGEKLDREIDRIDKRLKSCEGLL